MVSLKLHASIFLYFTFVRIWTVHQKHFDHWAPASHSNRKERCLSSVETVTSALLLWLDFSSDLSHTRKTHSWTWSMLLYWLKLHRWNKQTTRNISMQPDFSYQHHFHPSLGDTNPPLSGWCNSTPLWVTQIHPLWETQIHPSLSLYGWRLSISILSGLRMFIFTLLGWRILNPPSLGDAFYIHPARVTYIYCLRKLWEPPGVYEPVWRWRHLYQLGLYGDGIASYL